MSLLCALPLLSPACPTFLAPAFQDPAQIAGRWEGKIEEASLAFDVDFVVIEGSLSGDISIPAQGAKDIDLKDLSFSERQVTFVISGIPGDPTFDGLWSEDGDSIAGSFSQGGAELTFAMERAQSSAELGDSLEDLRPALEAMLESWEVPGLSLGVVRGDDVLMLTGMGTRDIGAEDAPVGPDTLFAIGSATKAFTTTSVAMLVEEGELDWDRPVIRDLDGFRLQDDFASLHLTLRDMASHRSGMPRHDLIWYGDHEAPLANIVPALEFLDMNAGLRAQPQYNNLMIAALGQLVAQTSAQSYEDFVSSRIFAPLGMTRSTLSVAELAGREDCALPHDKRSVEGEDEDKLQVIPYREIKNVAPAGSIQSSAKDMLAWVRVQLGQEVGGQALVSSATLAELHTPVSVFSGLPTEPEFAVTTYALGWFVDGYRGHLRVHHGGNIDGFSALVTFYPHADLGIVALTNANATPVPEFASRLIADHVLGLESRDWSGEALARRGSGEDDEEGGEATEEEEASEDEGRVQGTQPSRPLEQFVGAYEHPAYGSISIGLEAEQLTVAMRGMTGSLQHWHYDVFHGDSSSEPLLEEIALRFTSDMQGQISGVELPLEPSTDPIHFTRAPDAKLTDPAYLARFVAEYEDDDITASITLRGSTVILTVPGQPPYDLEPMEDDRFRLVVADGFFVQFLSADDKVTGIKMIQPNGSFELVRIEAEGSED